MDTGFIGAGSSADRRRRRLAQDASAPTASTAGRRAPSRPSPQAPESTEQPPIEGDAPLTPHPRDSLIPYSPWRLAGIILLGVVLWGTMLVVGQSTAIRDSAFREILSLENRRLPRFFSTVCLLATTQLTFLILWYRIRSRKDFGGRYRVWWLAGAFWAIACCCVTTDLHHAFARWGLRQYPMEAWRAETLYWLVPASIAFLAMHRVLQVDMRHARVSRIAWDISWWCAVAATLVLLLGNQLVATDHVLPLQVATATLWHLSAASAFLIHARFVVHVTNEAAPKKPSRMVRLWRKTRAAAERVAERIPPIRLQRKHGDAAEPVSRRQRKSARTPVATATNQTKDADSAQRDNLVDTRQANDRPTSLQQRNTAQEPAPETRATTRHDGPHPTAAPQKSVRTPGGAGEESLVEAAATLTRQERRRQKKKKKRPGNSVGE
ncbi:MAG: hypothetical protein KDA58_02945 [Planctomycetaceae bacterium]|nr:hypothetical protein [Planctomycetaceae bacterium]